MKTVRSLAVSARALSLALLVSVVSLLLPATPVQAADLDLIMGGSGSIPWNHHVKPGFSGTETVTLRNTTRTSGTVYIWLSNIVSLQSPGSDQPGVLDQHLLLAISGPGLVSSIPLPNVVGSFPTRVPDGQYVRVSIPARTTITLEWSWVVPPELGNEAQGNVLSFDINYTLDLPAPPPRPTTSSPSLAYEGADVCFFDVDMLGIVTRIYVTCADGRCTQDYLPTDRTGGHVLDLRRNTQVTYELEGKFYSEPPRWIRMRVSESPPPIPPGMAAVSDVYDFTGYTDGGVPTEAVFFDQRVGMELEYDPDVLPQNTGSIGIAYWDADAAEWELLPQPVGRVASIGTAAADVTRFSTYAVLATVGPSPVAPRPAAFVANELTTEPVVENFWSWLRFFTRVGKSAIVSVAVTNSGETAGSYTVELRLDGVVVGRQPITLQGGDEGHVTFMLKGLSYGVHQVEAGGLVGSLTAYRDVNWWLIVAIACLLLATWYVTRRLRRRSPNH